MKHTFWGTVPLLLAAAAWGQEFKPGAKAPQLELADVKGGAYSFSARPGEISVVMFVSTRCPVSNAYNERMNALVSDYQGRVRFVFVNSNGNETAADVAAHVQSHNLAFTPYKDPENRAADRLGATVTPEAFVIGKNGTLEYHGSIDDSQNPARIQYQGLRKALDAVLAGQPVERAETKAFGCTIKRTKKVT